MLHMESAAANAEDPTPIDFIRAHYTKYAFMIPMRDKTTRLFTQIYVPKNTSTTWPIMMKRTPYGIPPYGIDEYPRQLGPTFLFTEEKFIFVYQDTRGRGMSEGTFADIPPQNTPFNDGTDAYDTIEWLMHNLPNHNGRVGSWGASYNGFTAGCTLVKSHDALKAVSSQAPTSEQGNGDDAYHNGCFCLAAEFNFYATFTPREGGPAPARSWPPPYDYDTPDMYDFFLKLGPIANAKAHYFNKPNRYWDDILAHPNYDKWWQERSLSGYMERVKPAVMVVGGWYDAQDLAGPFALFKAIEETRPAEFNTLVVGPWKHGGWSGDAGDTLGKLVFGVKTGEEYRRDMELAFFMRRLKNAPGAPLPKALIFNTGKNEWLRLDAWPPKGVARSLFLSADGALSWEPAANVGYDEYISDPAHPVPVLPTFTSVTDYNPSTLPPFNYYMTEDQRFATKRPDVRVYWTEALTEDITIAGPIGVALSVSTSGTDSDFVVKLIDVYPNDYPDPLPNPENIRRAGFQHLVRGEPFRGKFRNCTLQTPEPTPFKPDVPDSIEFQMPDVCHTFRRGHKIMVHVQSSWFPLIDRNPQQFVNIPTAAAEDFKSAVQRIYRGGPKGSRLLLHTIP